jgi:hypothetical protein
MPESSSTVSEDVGHVGNVNCLFKNNDESASDSGEISTPTSASRTKLSQHMVLKSVLKAKE